MFGRTCLQRTLIIFVALLLTAGSTHAAARGFHAVDTLNEDHPTQQSLRFMGGQIHERAARREGVPLMREQRRDPASARLIERIRKVE